MKVKVLQALKPKVTALGFSKTELDGVAASIAQNLTDESTDEEISAAIDAVIPFLKVSQQYATRVINEKSKRNPKKTDEEEEEEEEPNKGIKAVLDSMKEIQTELAQLRAEKQAGSREKLFSAAIEKVPSGEKARLQKAFGRMSFKDDEDFEAYLQEVKDDVKDIVQDLDEEELIVNPPKGGRGKKESDEFIGMMKIIGGKKEE